MALVPCPDPAQLRNLVGMGVEKAQAVRGGGCPAAFAALGPTLATPIKILGSWAAELSDPGPKLGLHRSIDLLGRSVKARPDQGAITHQEREQFSTGFRFTGMAFHHPINKVNQAIGGVGRGGQGAFDSLFHQGNPRFSQ